VFPRQSAHHWRTFDAINTGISPAAGSRGIEEVRPMPGFESSALNRRSFLQAGAVATASAVTASGRIEAADPPAQKAKALPTRPLGKTGVDVTILNIGTWLSPGLDRLVRTAYASGVRVFDAADCYGSETGLGRWFQERPEVRKEIFLVTKDHPRQG